MRRQRCAALAVLFIGACCIQAALSQETSTSTTTSTTTEKSNGGGLLGAAKSAAGKAVDAVGTAGRYVATKTTDEDICYDVLGCFSLKSPWVSLKRPLPTPYKPEDIDTRFYLYTRAHPKRYNVTTFPEINLKGSDYNGNRPTFFIVHGFSSDGNATWLSDLKDALLSKVDGNVFLVDWGNGASTGNYFQVAANTRIVGAETARLGQYLIEEHGAKPAQFHFLGHSLGSQISSYAAKNITNVGRITAMDPAQPAFEGLDPEVRLDVSDATFIDVIHTNAKPFIPLLGFGMMRPVGHVDFYVNGGADQPGCELPKLDAIKSLGDLAKIPITGNLVSCSHGRSYQYVTEAIKSDCRMWGHKVNLAQQLLNWGSGGHLAILTTNGKCKTGECTPLGLDTPSYPTRGAFSVGTGPSQPYCVRDNSDDGQDTKELAEVGALDNNGTASTMEKENSTITEKVSGFFSPVSKIASFVGL